LTRLSQDPSLVKSVKAEGVVDLNRNFHEPRTGHGIWQHWLAAGEGGEDVRGQDNVLVAKIYVIYMCVYIAVNIQHI